MVSIEGKKGGKEEGVWETGIYIEGGSSQGVKSSQRCINHITNLSSATLNPPNEPTNHSRCLTEDVSAIRCAAPLSFRPIVLEVYNQAYFMLISLSLDPGHVLRRAQRARPVPLPRLPQDQRRDLFQQPRCAGGELQA